MRTPTQQENGIVAVLDALGAANYTNVEIERFMRSRENVLTLLNQKAEDVLGENDSHMAAPMITTFTFNDTVIVILRTGRKPPSLQEITAFFMIMRKFLVDSLQHRILFRGSVAIGTFYVNDKTNTVMGEAVTDAAAWYNRAEWIGVHATPRTTLIIQRWLEHERVVKGYVMIDYDIPLKGGSTVRAKAVNWPKIFFVKPYTPCSPKERPREKLLEFLSFHQVPLGVETKYFNTLAFFDHAAAKVKEENRHLKVKIKSAPSRP